MSSSLKPFFDTCRQVALPPKRDSRWPGILRFASYVLVPIFAFSIWLFIVSTKYIAATYAATPGPALFFNCSVEFVSIFSSLVCFGFYRFRTFRPGVALGIALLFVAAWIIQINIWLSCAVPKPGKMCRTSFAHNTNGISSTTVAEFGLAVLLCIGYGVFAILSAIALAYGTAPVQELKNIEDDGESASMSLRRTSRNSAGKV